MLLLHASISLGSSLVGLGFSNLILTLDGIFIASPTIIASPVRNDGSKSIKLIKLSGADDFTIDWSLEFVKRNAKFLLVLKLFQKFQKVFEKLPLHQLQIFFPL